LNDIDRRLQKLEDSHLNAKKSDEKLRDRLLDLEANDDYYEEQLDQILETVSQVERDCELNEKGLTKIRSELEKHQADFKKELAQARGRDSRTLVERIDEILEAMESEMEDAVRIRVATDAIEKADAIQGMLRMGKGLTTIKEEDHDVPMKILPSPPPLYDSPEVRGLKRRRQNGSSSRAPSPIHLFASAPVPVAA
jgi:predicted house-cleaning noncanonical NTP pyrophosphatase (MazG superfamily)